MSRPFRFAVTVRWAGGGTRWREFARRAEAQGYDALLVTDHMGPQLAAVPAMMAAADATERLRVGSFVFANDYRNPVMLAKEIATMDAISGGRVDLGIGAGWRMGDYRELGIPYDTPATRVARLEEAVHLLKRLFTEEYVDHAGAFYTVRRAHLLPRPVQRPYPPFMIGGGGPRVLRLAARQADIVSFIPSLGARGRPRLSTLSTRSLTERIARFRRYAGPRADEVELNVWLLDAGISDSARTLVRAAATTAKRGMNAMMRFPFLLYGTRSSVRELLRERRERFGINYVSIPGQAMDEFAPVVQELRGT
ncbi:MAG TPA: TIGR03621 family F420-dependent LLM class oxidoreductase [Candidatus Limnocylindria bacterium]|nr:TIGR03621 family F420-dependent LLM class oxidoreductase [Candidatus Limnocylindria bacterium]